MSELTGMVALVTGAGRGVGRAEAHYLAALGATVIVNDVTADAASIVTSEIVGDGGRAIGDESDVSDWEQAAAMITNAFDAFGRLDILVNNAGILRSGEFPQSNLHEWEQVIRVCLTGHAGPVHAVARAWIREGADPRRRRRIINTTSLAGLYGSMGHPAYSAAKAGVLGLTWSLAREFADIGVTVNAIAPRASTRMTMGNEGFDADGDFFDPALVAPLVGWLASPLSSEHTGRVFVVGAGRVWPMSPMTAYGPYDLKSWPPGKSAEADLALPSWKSVDGKFR